MKLNRRNLEHLTDRVAKPVYLAQATRHGIAHIGVGGFHRAHQAYYTDQLLNSGRDLDWSICGIGLRDEDRKVRDDLAGQDYLYTLFELDDGDDSQSRIIGSISDMLLAQDSIGAVIDKLASPDIRIVSLTITEGGIASTTATASLWPRCRRFSMTWPTPIRRPVCSAYSAPPSPGDVQTAPRHSP